MRFFFSTRLSMQTTKIVQDTSSKTAEDCEKAIRIVEQVFFFFLLVCSSSWFFFFFSNVLLLRYGYALC